MAILEPITNTEKGYLFWCPGCQQPHRLDIRDSDNVTHPSWVLDGSLEKPTFSPSYLVNMEEGPKHPAVRCHLFIRNGQIEFLDDCTHGLKGKTVPMEDFDDD